MKDIYGGDKVCINGFVGTVETDGSEIILVLEDGTGELRFPMNEKTWKNTIKVK